MQNHEPYIHLQMDLRTSLPTETGWEISIQQSPQWQFGCIDNPDHKFFHGSVLTRIRTWTDSPEPLLTLIFKCSNIHTYLPFLVNHIQGNLFSFRFPVLHLHSTNCKWMSQVFIWCVWFYSMCHGFGLSPVLASILSVVDRCCEYSALGIPPFWHTWQGNYQFWYTRQHPVTQHQTAVLNISMNHSSHSSGMHQGEPRIASSRTKCNCPLHLFS
jgi:hypothetical protein